MVISATNYDAAFQPINSGYPSASVGSYLVQTGDTLQSIAQSAMETASCGSSLIRPMA